MTQPPAPAIDFGKMMFEGFLPARDALIAPILASVDDALTLTGIGFLVLVAFALAVACIASRDFVKAVLGVLGAGCLLILATAWWGHTTATPASASLGALLLLGAVLKGWRGGLRLPASSELRDSDSAAMPVETSSCAARSRFSASSRDSSSSFDSGHSHP